MRIDHILGEEVAEKVGPLLLELVWNKILSTSALIFDLRYTGTGDVSGIPYIVSYFTEVEPLIHIDTIYDRPSNSTTKLFSMSTLLGQRYGVTKPLIVLTSKNTKGIAEDVAYCLQNLKRATVVGEKTAGGSVKVDKFKLGDTDFYVTVPTAKSINPITGSTWEVTGMTPDVEVNAEDALATAIKIINLRAQVPAIIEETATLIANNYAFENIGADVAEKLKELQANGEYSMVISKSSLETKLSADLKTLSGDKSLKADSNIPPLPPVVRLLYDHYFLTLKTFAIKKSRLAVSVVVDDLFTIQINLKALYDNIEIYILPYYLIGHICMHMIQMLKFKQIPCSLFSPGLFSRDVHRAHQSLLPHRLVGKQHRLPAL